MKHLSLVIFCLSFVTQLSLAQESRPYLFSGPCTSQGSWTQNALNTTNSIRELTLQLRDDPNCRALSARVGSVFDKLEQSFNQLAPKSDENASDFNQGVSNISQLPQEINAMQSFMSGLQPSMASKNSFLEKLLYSGLKLSYYEAASPETALITSFGKRINVAGRDALSSFNDVIDTFPQIQQCLANPNDMGQLFSLSVKTLSAFAGGGVDSTGNLLAKAVSKLSAYTREKKFADVLGQLNQSEFLMSMTCMMEVVSESYCSARDMRKLVNKSMDGLEVVRSTDDVRKIKSVKDSFDLKMKAEISSDSENPMNGYYVLTQHVANINNWIQKIQLGVDPKLGTDAIFKNRVIKTANVFLESLNSIRGKVSEQIQLIQSTQGLAAKQGYARDLVKIIVGMMTGSLNGQDSDVGSVNFYTAQISSIRLPFELMGIPVPPQVSGAGGQGNYTVKMSWDEWLDVNYASLPQFQDPEKLAVLMNQRLDDIVALANASMIEYYNKWFIVDKPLIVQESLVSMTYSVRDSLQAISDYLGLLLKKVSKYHADKSNIPAIYELKMRIGKVLAAYKPIDNLGAAVLTETAAKKAHLKIDRMKTSDIVRVYSEFINTVFEEFNLLQARSGYISNRMANYVFLDYSLMVKNNVNFSKYEKELLLATGRASVDRLMGALSSNPALVDADLVNAMTLGKQNVQAVEGLLKDYLISHMAMLKLVSENTNTDNIDVTLNSLSRSYQDYMNQGKTHLENSTNIAAKAWWSLDLFVRAVTSPLWMPIVDFQYSERYPLKSLVTKDPQGGMLAGDTEFKDSAKLLARLCTQVLGFNGWSEFRTLCENATLESTYIDQARASLSGSALKSFNDYYSVNFMQKARANLPNDPALNHSDRICAYRDYNRKNYVLYLTLDKARALTRDDQ